jgi:general secretion pathway protein E
MNFEIDNEIIDFDLAQKLKNDFWLKNEILPLSQNNFVTQILCANEPTNILDFLEQTFHSSIIFIKIPKNSLLLNLDNLQTKINLWKMLKLSQFDQTKIEQFFEMLFDFCINKNISDIHIESKISHFMLRVRIDGILIKLLNAAGEYFGILSSYLKLISKLDISQKRLPQNGRFTRELNQIKFDFRISCMPTINGESIVTRILNNQTIEIKLDSLGFGNLELKLIKHCISFSNGLILVSGPTGSGKTTTLYALIKELNSLTKKIITIEEPVEHKIENIQQIGINNEIGLDFITVLKNTLRQDPDIIMIGEIRDKESLNIAIAAALTGHLVIATIHTNSAILTIDRMLDLGADPFLISSTLKAVIAQRLIRRICQDCFGNRCLKCNMSGYIGREIVSEILVSTANISEAIAKKIPSSQIQKIAIDDGFVSMADNGKTKVSEKLITLQDLILSIE